MGKRLQASAKYGTDWWLTSEDAEGSTWTHDRIQIVLLQEIRDELQALNRLLRCPNFTKMPQDLRKVRVKVEAMTVRRPRRRSAAKSTAKRPSRTP